MSDELLIYREEVASTNDVVTAWIREGCPDGRAVWAGTQSAGRGRLGREWFSPPGENLYLSVAIAGPAYGSCMTIVPLAAAVGAAEAIAVQTGVEASLKWPNDLLVDGKKVAGVLCEAVTEHGSIVGAAVGVGVNANTPADGFPEPLLETATSLRVAAGRDIVLADLAAAVRRGIVAECERLAAYGAEGVLARWRARDATTGRRVRWDEGGEARQGTAEALAPDGGLQIRTGEGATVVIRSGEVRFEPLDGG